MLVQARPGIKVPKENKPREFIVDTKAVDVPDTAYYRRRLRDGDLVAVTATGKKSKGD